MIYIFGEQIDKCFMAFLELIVNIPWFENSIRSYRLSEEDWKVVSSKGYHIYDAGKNRFVKEVNNV